mmetsp:Transcript_22670/g.55980  ORF Transcript_22670/g.55980 Transcript_22670/m.55980 type:complete len:466 (-) Transcript_22670:92-1489(-)
MRACIALLLALCASPASAQSAGTEATLKALQPTIGYNAQTFSVALHVAPPFVEYDSTKTGNARFSGYTIDFLVLIEKVLDVRWTFSLGSDTFQESADAAIAQIGVSSDAATGAIHITHNRTMALRFAMPFYYSGYLVIVKMPTNEPQPFSFFAPFDDMLWLAIVIEILLVAATFFLLEAPGISPESESDLVEGYISSALDALYWSLSAFTTTLDKAPKTWGGKLMMLGHGWFMLIILASYTANLASFLTTASLAPSINGWSDLTVPGNTYKIAIPRGQSHQRFLEFEKGHYGYKFNNVIYTNTFEEAFAMVAAGTADATFEDAPIAQHYLQTVADPCSLTEVGSLFAPVGYGIAFSVNSSDYLRFSEAIVYLTEIGELEKLNTKYNIGSRSTIDTSMCGTNTSGVLTVDELWGLMLMTGVLMVLGLLVNVGQRSLKKRKVTPSSPPTKATGDNGFAAADEGTGAA